MCVCVCLMLKSLIQRRRSFSSIPLLQNAPTAIAAMTLPEEAVYTLPVGSAQHSFVEDAVQFTTRFTRIHAVDTCVF